MLREEGAAYQMNKLQGKNPHPRGEKTLTLGVGGESNIFHFIFNNCWEIIGNAISFHSRGQNT